MDCPPVPPSCTEAWSSVSLQQLPAEGVWPHLTLRMECGTGLSLPEAACDVVEGSLWAVLTAYETPYAAWDWQPLLTGLYLPADGSGEVSAVAEIQVHLRDWSYASDQGYPATCQCAAVNLDHAAVALSCPEQEAPVIGICTGWYAPQWSWPHDLDGSGAIDEGDLLEVLEHWGVPWDVQDFLDILRLWGTGSPWA